MLACDRMRSSVRPRGAALLVRFCGSGPNLFSELICSQRFSRSRSVRSLRPFGSSTPPSPTRDCLHCLISPDPDLLLRHGPDRSGWPRDRDQHPGCSASGPARSPRGSTGAPASSGATWPRRSGGGGFIGLAGFRHPTSRSLPPDECWRGTSPSHAEKSRPRRKFAMSGAKASTASAVSGPTPGIVCKRRAVSLLSARFFAIFVRARCELSSRQSAPSDPGTRHGRSRARRQARRGSPRCASMADALWDRVTELVEQGP